MPFFCVEFGCPLQVSYHRGRDGYDNSINTEPWNAEFCAIYFGNQAYTLETPQYRELIRNLFQGSQTYARSLQSNPTEIHAPNVQQLQELFIRNTWRSWRTMGNTAGMIPWENGHGWAASRTPTKK